MHVRRCLGWSKERKLAITIPVRPAGLFSSAFPQLFLSIGASGRGYKTAGEGGHGNWGVIGSFDT